MSLVGPLGPSFGLVCLVLMGCGPTPDPSAASDQVGQPGATVRQPIQAVQRPDVVRSFPIDYASLPHLVAAPMTPAEFDSSISFRRSSAGVERAQVADDRMVEIEISGVRAFTSERIEDPLSAGSTPAKGCDPKPGTEPVSWEGFSLATWTDLFIDYVRFEGTYDFTTCRAKPTRFARVRAPALVPGVAYAFRTCSPVCTAAPTEAGGEELLVIVAPPARWVGATVPWPKIQTEPHVGLFTRLIVPLERGGSASTFLHVSRPELEAFRTLRHNKSSRAPDLPDVPLVQLSFDFSWLEGDPSPVGMGFVGTVSTTPATSQAL